MTVSIQPIIMMRSRACRAVTAWWAQPHRKCAEDLSSNSGVKMRVIAANEPVVQFGPHPEEAALLGGRLEGWPVALPCPWPSFETRREDAALLRMRAFVS